MPSIMKPQRKGGGSMDGIIISLYAEVLRNQIFELVMVAIVIDTIFGVLRAIKEKKFNSNLLMAKW